MDGPSPRYVVATTIASGLAILGAWFPWAGSDGESRVTHVPGATFGFAGTLPDVVLPAVVVVGVVVASYYRGWRTDWVLLVAGLTMIAAAADSLALYRALVGWGPRLGIFIVFASGIALLVLAVGQWSGRRRSGTRADPPSGA